MVLRVPTGDGVLVVLVQQEPSLLAGVVGAGADQNEATLKLLTEKIDVQLTFRHCAAGVRLLALDVMLPRPRIPDDHVAAAVLSGRDEALEVEVLDRVVFDVKGRSAYVWVKRRALRHGPADEDPVDFKAEVVMQPARTVPLYDESRTAVIGPLRIDLARGL